MSVTVDELVAAARSYTGVRWHHQGRTRAGLDCVGLIICVLRDLGLSDYDVGGYGALPDGTMSKVLRERCILQSPGTEPAPGMIAEMRFEVLPQHLGFIVPYHLGGVSLLHVMSLHPRKVTEHRLDDVWRRRIAALYRIPGVTEG